MGIVEFLNARIDEDEATARAIHAARCETPAETTLDSMGRPMAPSCDCDWHVARVLAECGAKRRQIEHLIRFMEGDYAPWNEGQLRIMATVYSDHPDYRDDW